MDISSFFVGHNNFLPQILFIATWVEVGYFNMHIDQVIISIINHTLPSTIMAVISTLTCTSMASNSTSDSQCY